MNISAPDYILSIKPYVPGKPLEELQRDYGIADSIKLASNENPLGPSPKAIEAIQAAIGKINRYPDGGGYELIQRIAEKLNIKPENIVIGAGSDEIIGMLTRVFLQPGDEAIIPRPSFLVYDIMIRCSGATPIGVPLKSDAIDCEGMLAKMSPNTRMIFVDNPHNPTGTLLSKAEIDKLIGDIPPDVVLVIDEAYYEFVRDPDCPSSIDYLNSGKAVVGLRTFSKAFGLAGLRVGYGVMPPALTELLTRVRQPFNVNSLAQTAAIAALGDEGFLRKTVKLVHAELDFMYRALDRLGVEYRPSQSNFLLIRVGKDADEVFEQLLKHGVIIRSMTSYDYPNHIRVNIGLHHENVRFLEALQKVI